MHAPRRCFNSQIHMKVISNFALAASLALLSTSCASIMTGKTDMLDVTSTPEGAHFSTNTGDSGMTPATLKVPSNRDVIFMFTMAGYQDATKVSIPHRSKWIWGNVLIGGLIGIVVDLATDTSLTHDDVNVTLTAL